MTYRSRNITIALALGLGAVLLVTLYVKNSGSSSSVGKELVSVFVASHDISAGTPGAELGGSIRPQEVPKTAVAAGAIASQSQVRGLVATEQIDSGQQVTTRQFQPLGAEGTRGQITGTQRAIVVPGDANQLLVGIVKEGDRVDVLANIKYRLASFRNAAGANPHAEQADLVATRIVLRDLLVLQAPEAPPGTSKFANNSEWAATLALTDNQAQKLFFIMNNGDWSLELRPVHAAADSPGSVETTGSILGDGLKAPQFAQLVFGPQGPR